jgi:hypothetical protein
MHEEERSLKEAIAGAKADVEFSRNLSATFKTDRLEALRKIAGPIVETMLQSRSAAEGGLGESSPKVRLAALSILADYWLDRADIAKTCQLTADNDQDSEVVALALGLLCECFEKTNDRRTCALLARLVRDETRPTSVRSAAYNALFEISGQPVDRWPTTNKYLGNWQFPNDVDWKFVDSFTHIG